MNSIQLLGRLVRDPEIRYTTTGKPVAQFTLAVNRPFKSEEGKQETDFINCVIWGKAAETIGNYVQKGNRLLVEGRLQIRDYDAKDGSKRWVTEVICNRFDFIETKSENQSNTSNSGMEAFGDSVPFNPDDVPF